MDKIVISLPREVVDWIWSKAIEDRRDFSREVLWILEQVKKAEEYQEAAAAR
jgi:hypothetical protein